MSALPSPSKSPVPKTVQGGGTEPRLPLCETWRPLSSQIAIAPLLSRHSQSCLPSPLKSRCPTICQLGGTVPRPTDSVTWAAFISQMAVTPPFCCHVMSLVQLPLKSWVLFADAHIRPILLPVVSANHNAPSGPATMPMGLLPAVGIGNSVIAPPSVMRPILLPLCSV